MKTINLLSLIQAKCKLEPKVYKNFLRHHKIKIRDHEIQDLKELIELLLKSYEYSNGIVDKFYVGYKIPQIDKEFDLLRIGETTVINIELKRESESDKVKKQLIKNEYYLNYLQKELYYFSFISSEKKLYQLQENEITEVGIDILIELLSNQKPSRNSCIADLFNPSDYLVSPFNSTQEFIDNKYFLTQQQEQIKQDVLELIKDKCTSYISITGNAGTGKTLLTYDLARSLKNCKDINPIIIHCGMLNEGQENLNNSYKWNIVPIKEYSVLNTNEHSVVFIDEAQRIRTQQLNDIIKFIDSSNTKCIFSYDKNQTLSLKESNAKVYQKIENLKPSQFNLTGKIRTNKEISQFIKMLFDKKESLEKITNNNIVLNYFFDSKDAVHYTHSLDENEWEILKFTPDQYGQDTHKSNIMQGETSHSVIGQEFDSVSITIDPYFQYNKENGKLIYNGKSHYDAVQMLFQNITRTKKRLNVVIINNEALLTRCIEILND